MNYRQRRRVAAVLVALLSLLYVATSVGSLALFTDSTPVGANLLGTDTLESPTGLAADASTPGQVELTWTATTDTYADGYNIYSSDTPGTGYTLIGSVVGSATVTYTDTDPGQPGCTNNAGYIAHESDVNNFSTTSATVNVPAATTIDDLLIAHIAVEGDDPGYSTPTGWTLLATNNPGDGSGQAVYYRIADGTEPSSYTFTWSDNQDSIATITTYTGIDTTTPINASATDEGSTNDPIAPSVTTTATDTIVVRLVSNNHDHTTTAPAGVTTRFNLGVDGVVSVGGDSTQSGAGATGTAVFDDASGAHDWAATTIALTQQPACTAQYYVVQATAQNWNSPNSNEVLAEPPGYSEVVTATAGLVSYWRLGATTTSLTAPDEVGSNDGTPSGGVTTQVGGALVGDTDTAVLFNGSSGMINAGNDASLQLSSGSVEFWMRTSDAGSSYADIVGKDGAFYVTALNNTLGVYDPGSSNFRSTGESINDDVWHHVVMTYQSGVSSGTRIYLDGTLVRTTTITINNQSNPLMFGAWSAGSAFYAGRIDEVAIYNTVLSAATVTEHYEAGS